MARLDSSSEDDDIPLAARARATSMGAPPVAPSHASERPTEVARPSAPVTTGASAGTSVGASAAGDASSDDDDVPLAQRAKLVSPGKPLSSVVPRPSTHLPAAPAAPAPAEAAAGRRATAGGDAETARGWI